MAIKHSRTHSPIEDDEEYWDGVDRRNQDRRYHQVPPAYYQYPPYTPPPPQQPQQSQSSQSDTKNVAQHTLTLQQLGGILVVVGSVILSGFSAWSNINKELDIQKNNFDQFKVQISRDVNDVQDNMKELKRITEDMRAQNQKTFDALAQRIQDLDTSLAQIYQKVSSK